MTCAPSEDSDQSVHPPSLISLRYPHEDSWVLSYPLSAQRRLWSDWTDAQADLSLRWVHMSFCWFCCTAAQIKFLLTNGGKDGNGEEEAAGVVPLMWWPIIAAIIFTPATVISWKSNLIYQQKSCKDYCIYVYEKKKKTGHSVKEPFTPKAMPSSTLSRDKLNLFLWIPRSFSWRPCTVCYLIAMKPCSVLIHVTKNSDV